MKALIWFLCFFVLAFVQMLFKDAGIILGGIPTALLWGLTWWIVKKLCSAWDKHKAKKVAEAVSRQSAEKALAGFVAEVATEQAKLIKENKAAQSMNLNDPEYGLVPEKPVYCCYVDGSEDYLNSLRTENGEKLAWNRRGSMYADGINGMVDIYDSTLPNGHPYKTVYVNMYSDSNPIAMPKGFILHFPGKKGATPAPTPAKPKTRFCKLCGNPIDPVTRKCTSCKKQYFRLPTFTDKHWFIAALAVACAVILFLLFVLAARSNQVAELAATVTDLESKLTAAEQDASYQKQKAETNKSQLDGLRRANEELRNKVSDMGEKVLFFDRHAVFVLDDGSKEYHTYDCAWRKYSGLSFWIYNTEAAESKGYKPHFCCD